MSLMLAAPACAQVTGSNYGPALAETTKWISNTFRENAGVSFCNEFDSNKQPGSEYGSEFSCLVERYDVEFAGCSLTLYSFHSHTHSPCDLESCKDGEDRERDEVAHVGMGSLDPASISIGEPFGEFGSIDKKTWHANRPKVNISFKTTNDEQVIELSLPWSEGKSSFKTGALGTGNWFTFIGLDPEYAPRFKRALAHAIELCGGKPSAF